MNGADHELDFLISLDGSEFRFASGYTVRIAAQAMAASNTA